MVRNTTSIPNLRDDMENLRPAVQLRGADAYTKSLMNRVATGEASEAERRLFDERVQNLQTSPSEIPHLSGSTPSQFGPSKLGATPETGSSHALRDYNFQLAMLEEQNKRRLQMQVDAQEDGASKEEEEEDQDEDEEEVGSEMPPVASSAPLRFLTSKQAATLETSNNNHALQDFQMQLMLLEQQNKKRNLMAQQGQDDGTGWERGDTTLPTTDQASMSTAAGMEGPTLVPGVRVDPAVLFAPKHKSRTDKKGSGRAKKISIPVEGPSHEGVHTIHDKYGIGMPAVFPEYNKPTEYEEQFSKLSLDDVPSKKAMKKKGGLKKQKKRVQTNEKVDPGVPPVQATREAASVYTQPFCDFLTNNPTVFHAVDYQKKQLLDLGWTELDERKKWEIVPGGKYFVERNGSSMIAFSVGEDYKPGNGCAIIAGHVDALTAKLKPISEVPNKAGYVQLGVAPYAGALNSTWWDRDLGIGGRVLLREKDKIVTKLVKLDWPIARIPTLAPHFGAAASGPFNPETQMVPIIGLEGTTSTFSDVQSTKPFSQPPLLGGEKGPVGNFVNTQPPGLVKAIGDALGLTASTYGNIVNWELELFDIQPATVGGLNKEFIFAGRVDDKLCSWAAMQALISGQQWDDAKFSSAIKMVGWFDNEEIGSQLRQGAKSNFLPLTIERVVGCLGQGKTGANLVGRTYANSFLLSSDVTHAVNPNFLGAYLENHAPHLNVGLSVHADPNGHMTTDAVSTAILQRCADSVGAKLQIFQIRNDSRSGGTVGPMLSSMTGIRAIDAGIPQLSMHSIRATIGSLDPGLGVITYMAFLNRYEHVDKEFQS